ncbi:hypothetical protein C8R45DRAFT_183382 [Mycena sanguinolenta]|nr:hypothetical protein C8R45DRAFT_183382 [Mycena sanguinolenta]
MPAFTPSFPVSLKPLYLSCTCLLTLPLLSSTDVVQTSSVDWRELRHAFRALSPNFSTFFARSTATIFRSYFALSALCLFSSSCIRFVITRLSLHRRAHEVSVDPCRHGCRAPIILDLRRLLRFQMPFYCVVSSIDFFLHRYMSGVDSIILALPLYTTVNLWNPRAGTNPP